MAKKEEKVLKPSIIPTNMDFNPENFFNKEENTNNIVTKDMSLPSIIEFPNDKNKDSETFFKEVIEQLMTGDKNIDLKTEYMHEDETFAGTKLNFLTEQCGFSSAKAFLPMLERKKVSQGRKSRQEITVSLWEREQQKKAEEERAKAKEGQNIQT